MIGYLVVAVLAAFGVVALVWAVCGGLLPGCRGDWILCPGRSRQLAFVYVYLWLRWAGIVTCPLIVVDVGLRRQEQEWLAKKGIEVCSGSDLPQWLEWEREGIDTGDGNCPGRC